MDKVFCNPIDLAYRYQDIRRDEVVQALAPNIGTRSVHREAADPSVVLYRGRFYLFASMSRGFWHSEDLVTWQHKPTDKLPMLDYAPDVREINGALHITASRRNENCPIFRSEDPLADDFVEVAPGSFPFFDPNLFQDSDGSLYLYWGCDNKTPVSGIRLDPETFEARSEAVELIGSDPTRHGWEQPGEDHVNEAPKTEIERITASLFGREPFIEGAWMTRRHATYYLQYAAPGTEVNTYADGYYTASSPLGPFEYSPHSPFSAKPGGFITGAGHGSTFQDAHGNWWHAATMRISVNHSFERRIGLFPAGFDEDGVLFCNQNFADYPILVPNRRFDPWTGATTGWMLLSYRAKATASSALDDHGPELAVDESVRTWWVAGSEKTGEWLQVDLGEQKTVHAAQINLADHELGRSAVECADVQPLGYEGRGIYETFQATEVLLEVSADGTTWEAVHDSRGRDHDAPHLFLLLDQPRRVRFLRVTAGRLPFDGRFAVSGLRVFGIGNGSPPDRVTPRALRTDELTARLAWDPVDGAQGYNVRYGLGPRKLYHSWMLYGRHDLDLRCLNGGEDYWVAIDAFNENGITPGPVVAIARRA